MNSSSSTESEAAGLSLPPGTVVAGFRVEAAIGRGSIASVYEAVQITLDRRVALKLFPPGSELGERLRQARWPEHPQVVRVYATGVCEHGHYLAMQLAQGVPLDERLSAGKLRAASARQLLEDVGAALDAAHRAGCVHGAITGRNVFVDRSGRALLSEFGLGEPGASPATDRAAFAALVRECGGRDLREPLPSSALEIARDALPDRRRRRAALAIAGVLGAGAALAVLLAPSRSHPQQSLPVLSGAIALGSALAPGDVESVDCAGRVASGASEPCTVVQTQLGGRPLVPRRGGVIRRWAVRGAQGDLALQVLRRRGDVFFMVARTQYAHIRDPGLHLLEANLPLRPGDLIGVEIAPGAAIGIRRAVPGAQTARWFGPVVLSVRRSERTAGSGFDHELLVRVEYAAGATWTFPGRLTGRDASVAPAGQRLGARVVQQRGSRTVSLVLVRAGGAIAVDLMNTDTRVARLPVTDADPGGRLLSFDIALVRFGRTVVRLRWANADRVVAHDYEADANSLAPLS